MFEWRYLGADGREAGTSEPFDDAASAEAWLGSSWTDLLDRGVEEVELVERIGDGPGASRYRMSLSEV